MILWLCYSIEQPNTDKKVGRKRRRSEQPREVNSNINHGKKERNVSKRKKTGVVVDDDGDDDNTIKIREEEDDDDDVKYGVKPNSDNQEPNDYITNKLKQNTKHWDRFYCSDIMRVKFYSTESCSDKECKITFDTFLNNNPKRVVHLGNTGYLGIKKENEDVLNTYIYSRYPGAYKKRHTELDVIDLFDGDKQTKGTILISSYYCPCISCLNKLVSFTNSHKNFKIFLRCYAFMSFKDYHSLKKYITKKDRIIYNGATRKRDILQKYYAVYKGQKKINRLEIHSPLEKKARGRRSKH